MSFTLLTLLPLVLSAEPLPPAQGGLLAVRVGRAETASHGAIEHAVILVEGGKIVVLGEDLPVERGIPVLDRPDWVVTPGLVNCYTRLGMDSTAGKVEEPQAKASGELYPRSEEYGDVLEAGVTTLGLHPAGTGMPGQAVAVRPRGDSPAEMILEDGVYLELWLESEPRSKKALRDALEKVDEYDEKVEKAREKWEKDQEKKSKKSSTKKSDDDKKEEDKEPGDEDAKADDGEEDSDEFVPPEPDEKVVPFVRLRDKELSALVRIGKAADYLHFLDVIGDRDFRWSLRAPLRNDIDYFEIADELGEKEALVVLDPYITLSPATRRERNIPAELQRAGAHVALLPRRDDRRGHQDWVQDVAELVARGMDRDAAIRAMTLEPARVLGLEERLGSLDPGKDANLLFWNGDPFQPGTRLQAVMLEGEFVHGEEEVR